MNHEFRQGADADPALYGFEDRVHVIHAQNRRTLLLALFPQSQKPIQIRSREAGVLAIDDNGVGIQIFRCLRHAASANIRRGGIDIDVHRHQVPLDEIGLPRRHHANRNIGFAHAEIQLALIQHQLDRDFRMKIQELLHPRRQPSRTEGHCSRHFTESVQRRRVPGHAESGV